MQHAACDLQMRQAAALFVLGDLVDPRAEVRALLEGQRQPLQQLEKCRNAL